MRKGTITATIIKSTKSTTSSLGSIFDLSRGMKFQKYGVSETGPPPLIENLEWDGFAQLYWSSYEKGCDCVCVGGVFGDVWVCGFCFRSESRGENGFAFAAGGEPA